MTASSIKSYIPSAIGGFVGIAQGFPAKANIYELLYN